MTEISRRRVLLGGVAAALSAFVAACTRRRDTLGATETPSGTSLEPTPSCEDGDEITPEQTEGPFFTPSSPEKRDLAADVNGGTKLVLTGTVLTTDCKPVEKALIDVWQADADGNYDNEGFRLRGHQFTDAQGAYALTTVVPGLYPGRTRHIHVKVQAPNGPVLTTQLYFPGEAQNASDGIFREECLIDMRDAADGKTGTFRFVVRT
ncbi:MAG TPA: dioxygenase [Actinomycetota bacterium]|jgi:protocatechuate 3,4-dioxygenase beta subunit|nr:dioxygenase [Actinomycetota bacterium]